MKVASDLHPLGKAHTVVQSDGYELRRADEPDIDILSVNADRSMTLALTLDEGESITWAIRQPLSAEQDMRKKLLAAVNPEKTPNFALMLSCIGRGPLLYGNDDCDLPAFREQFPGTPLLGTFGCNRIAPSAGKSH